jgi:methyltransferase (TIGR00027 family)
MSAALGSGREMMDPLAKTAYYCCGARAVDARSANPVCADHLADRFMDAEARSHFRPFAALTAANAIGATRHRIIDDLLRDRLRKQPDLPIVLLGAGFDTRAFRLNGGQWIEIDLPEIIALKNIKLPASQAANRLERVAIDFATEKLVDKLAPWAGTRLAVVVMEGVSMYLSREQLRNTAQALRTLLPGHTLICDLIDNTFLRRHDRRLLHTIRQLGGDFAVTGKDPAAVVVSMAYRHLAGLSIAERAVAQLTLNIPRWLLNSLLHSLRDGYCIHTFESLPLPSPASED